MNNYKQYLENQLIELDRLIVKNNKNITRLKDVPPYSVNISKSHDSFQYYLVEKASKKKRYAGKKQRRLVKKIVQRDYECMVNIKLLKLKKKIETFLRDCDIDEINKLYNDMPEARKNLITPIVETDDMYIQKWLEENPGNRNPYPEQGKYRTNRGEMVRSKSEKIIADALDKYNVPYQYEPMLEVGYSTFYPDFVALNIRTRQTKYWEHLGIVSDMEYATKNFSKIQSYEKNGYMIGRDLIITMESVDVSIDVKLVEEKIKEFFL